MGDQPFGWGIVGYGWVARDHMAPGILAGGGRVVGVADPSSAARLAARRAGFAAHADMSALLNDPAVEAVYVATPNHLHRAVVEACAAARKPVLCEKPMATTRDDVWAMVTACAATRTLYGTAFDQRWHPAHHAVRVAVAAGRIGTPTAIRIVYGCWLAADFAPCPGHDNWRIDAARAGGGAAIDLAPHGIDLAQFLLGEPLAALSAITHSRAHAYAVDDGALLMGQTVSGTLFQAHVAYNLPDALPRRRLEVTGTAGMIVAENTMGQTPGGSVTLIDADGRATAIAFDADESPFAAQARAFADAARRMQAFADAPLADWWAAHRDQPFDAGRDFAQWELLHQALHPAPAALPPPHHAMAAA